MNIQELFQIGMDREINWLLDHTNANYPIQLNLGAGNKEVEGAMSLDFPEWNADRNYIPMNENSVDVIHMYHFLEHIAEPVLMLKECQRILRPGGFINIVVPYYTSQMAAHDLDHKHVFCEETWKTLFSTPYYNKNKIDWQFDIHVNFIMGVVERNMALFTQLRKRK